ncbi:MAG: hypothetical protein ABI867_44725 [Kofleriaceae bacterium]
MKVLICSAIVVLATTGACGSDDDEIDSDTEARLAYLGLDTSIEKSITLGFDGFNSASSANITPQSTVGITAGTLTVTGQVDQGSSDNKGMRLSIGMVDYTDGDITDDDGVFAITYDTDGDPALQPFLSMQLKNIPDGTLDGTLAGTYVMSGFVEDEAQLDLVFTGDLEDDGAGGVTRVPGTTHVTGTATNNDGGVFEVDVML